MLKYFIIYVAVSLILAIPIGLGNKKSWFETEAGDKDREESFPTVAVWFWPLGLIMAAFTCPLWAPEWVGIATRAIRDYFDRKSQVKRLLRAVTAKHGDNFDLNLEAQVVARNLSREDQAHYIAESLAIAYDAGRAGLKLRSPK
jgi:hypothetical protein